MNPTQTYPGQGLSISQLVFALNEELKRVAYSTSYVAKDRQYPGERSTDSSCSVTLDQVSRLDQDTSSALATIREWRNSFAYINRIPLDILSLIPTHLPPQDRLRVSFVCRHWRRTFLQRAEIWSQLSLLNGEVYLKTLLERAKGSALDIIVDRGVPVRTMALLSPHTKRIKRLAFECNEWTDIQRFSEVNSGPLPLLHTLTINTTMEDDLHGFDMTPPSPPLLSNAVNLKAISLYSHSEWSPFLSHFVFPNLTSLDLIAEPFDEFRASQLLDFLAASPMLRTVHIKITSDISLEGVPQERVVVLPNVEDLDLVVNDGGPGFKIVAHVSCPSARRTSLMHRTYVDDPSPEEIFPHSVLWKKIVQQHTKSPVEEVTLEIKTGDDVIACRLGFRSTDEAVIELCFQVANEDEDKCVLPAIDMHSEVFSQATRTIRNHPQLANVKHLHICHSFRSVCSTDICHVADEVGRLFKSVGPLDELNIYHCDLRPYLHSFLSGNATEEPVVFPPIKELTISHPVYPDEKECTAIVELAKSQHALGMPFERVVVHEEGAFVGVGERLRPWVGSVPLL
jgi:hypothetical protein